MRPSARLLWIGWGVLALCTAALFFPDLAEAWPWWGGAVCLPVLLDAVLLLRRPTPEVIRSVASSISIGVWAKVGLRVENRSEGTTSVRVFDEAPDEAEVEGLPRELRIPPESGASIEYRLRPERRGDLEFQPAHLLLRSPLGLWESRRRSGEAEIVRVYPNFAAVAGLALHALENQMTLMGIRTRPRRGSGLDFHQLRDYQLGDSLRQIDWKATSRRRRAISREYQEERDQQIVFVVDCGRRMRSAAEGLSHFDHCLNSILLVSYIALRQGDAVGMLTFSGQDRWIPPRKGRATLHALLNGLYDLETTLEPPDYTSAATRVRSLQPKRSLIIFLTNQRDEDEQDLAPALSLLRRRHLVILASLREARVSERLEEPVHGFDDALSLAATQQYAFARRSALERAAGRNLLTLDVEAEELAVSLAKKYLDIKRAGQL